MADWLSGIDPTDLVRVELLRVTVEGTPSAVTHALVRLHLLSGTARVHPVTLDDPVIYETLADRVESLNRMLRRRRAPGRW